MKGLYDNGAIMLGNVKNIKKEIEKEIRKNIDMFCVDMEQLLKEIKDFNDDDIVAINYDNGMSYSIDYWNTKTDKIGG